MKVQLKVIKEIISEFIKIEENIESEDIFKRKWKQFINEKILEKIKNNTELEAENLLKDTLILLTNREESVDFFLYDELNKEKLFQTFYNEIFFLIFSNNKEYLKIFKEKSLKTNRKAFLNVLKSFLELKEEDLNKLFSLSCKDTKEKSKLEKVTKDNFFDNILKIVERIEKNFWDDLNFDELYFIEKFTEEYEKTNKNFVDILKVFKECNLFMKNILSYNEELIIQIYIETENTDEIRKNLSSIYCIIELFKKIKKRDKDFPYIKASKVYKILKKNS
jgi:hypothetical protein